VAQGLDGSSSLRGKRANCIGHRPGRTAERHLEVEPATGDDARRRGFASMPHRLHDEHYEAEHGRGRRHIGVDLLAEEMEFGGVETECFQVGAAGAVPEEVGAHGSAQDITNRRPRKMIRIAPAMSQTIS